MVFFRPVTSHYTTWMRGLPPDFQPNNKQPEASHTLSSGAETVNQKMQELRESVWACAAGAAAAAVK